MGTIVGGSLVGTGISVAVCVAITMAVGVLDGNSLAVGGTGVSVLVAVTVCVAEGVTDAVDVGTVAGTAVAVASTANVPATRCTDCGAQPANKRLKMKLTLVFNSLIFEWIHPLRF